ncbi:hypothetical protein FRX31_020197 [Thalictrum thalictroides]|uniref:Uncharacterized protein n=1 Tax=Thalictrum thalictroides TaxID=46969 RepID=A0A7J6VYM0_THATH|nr:hypothetical protein FRX31_020197 [Thalictrum thalictroides]
MGRPKRAVRSARDRWFRQKKFNPVLSRLFAAVRRTLCDRHYDQFESFRYGLVEVCNMIAVADPSIEEKFAEFFPDEGRVTQGIWLSFRKWLKTDPGVPFSENCLPWCQDVKKMMLECDECRGGEPILIDSDDEDEGSSDSGGS